MKQNPKVYEEYLNQLIANNLTEDQVFEKYSYLSDESTLSKYYHEHKIGTFLRHYDTDAFNAGMRTYKFAKGGKFSKIPIVTAIIKNRYGIFKENYSFEDHWFDKPVYNEKEAMDILINEDKAEKSDIINFIRHEQPKNPEINQLKLELGGNMEIKQLSNDYEGLSVSEGTLKTEHLINRFMWFLENHADECVIKDKVAKLKMDIEDSKEDEEQLDMILNEDLFDLMNEIAPEGTIFGSHEGDGADFGFWKVETEFIEFAKGGDVGRYTSSKEPLFPVGSKAWSMWYGEPVEWTILEHIPSSVTGSDGNDRYRHEYILTAVDRSIAKEVHRISQNYLASTKEELLEQYHNTEFAKGGTLSKEQINKDVLNFLENKMKDYEQEKLKKYEDYEPEKTDTSGWYSWNNPRGGELLFHVSTYNIERGVIFDESGNVVFDINDEGASDSDAWNYAVNKGYIDSKLASGGTLNIAKMNNKEKLEILEKALNEPNIPASELDLINKGIAKLKEMIGVEKPVEVKLTKQDYEDAIAGMRAMLDIVEGTTKTEYEDAIAGMDVMLDMFEEGGKLINGRGFGGYEKGERVEKKGSGGKLSPKSKKAHRSVSSTSKANLAGKGKAIMDEARKIKAAHPDMRWNKCVGQASKNLKI